jgi:hypothetical protein
LLDRLVLLMCLVFTKITTEQILMISDMIIVPVGSSLRQYFGICLVPQNDALKLAFLGWFYQDFCLLDCFIEAKSSRKPQIEATYIRIYDWDNPYKLILTSNQTKLRQKWQLRNNKLILFLNSIKVVPQACLPCLSDDV